MSTLSWTLQSAIFFKGIWGHDWDSYWLVKKDNLKDTSEVIGVWLRDDNDEIQLFMFQLQQEHLYCNPGNFRPQFIFGNFRPRPLRPKITRGWNFLCGWVLPTATRTAELAYLPHVRTVYYLCGAGRRFFLAQSSRTSTNHCTTLHVRTRVHTKIAGAENYLWPKVVGSHLAVIYCGRKFAGLQ